MDEVLRGWSGTQVIGFRPLLDVRETDEEYLVMIDVPGVKSEDVSIEVSDQVLTISSSRVPWRRVRRSSSSGRTDRSSAR